jgi:hypothetical protein
MGCQNERSGETVGEEKTLTSRNPESPNNNCHGRKQIKHFSQIDSNQMFPVFT